MKLLGFTHGSAIVYVHTYIHIYIYKRVSQKSNAFFFSIEIIFDIGTSIIHQNETDPRLIIVDYVLFLYDNDRPHSSIERREIIASLGWTTVPHPQYSPDLTPSDYDQFGPMKEGLRGKGYANEEKMKTAVINQLNFTRQRYMLSFEVGT